MKGSKLFPARTPARTHASKGGQTRDGSAASKRVRACICLCEVFGFGLGRRATKGAYSRRRNGLELARFERLAALRMPKTLAHLCWMWWWWLSFCFSCVLRLFSAVDMLWKESSICIPYTIQTYVMHTCERVCGGGGADVPVFKEIFRSGAPQLNRNHWRAITRPPPLKPVRVWCQTGYIYRAIRICFSFCAKRRPYTAPTRRLPPPNGTGVGSAYQ